MEGRPELLTVERCLGNDLRAFYRRLGAVVQRRGFELRVLGHVSGHPICYVERAPRRGGPSILVAAGFHGEEPGGPWGLLRFLERASDELLDEVHLSALPLVNPEGFRRNRRHNDHGQDPNRGFTRRASSEDAKPADLATAPSREGEILVRHLPTLLRAAKDGFLSLHEDDEASAAYAYAYGAHTARGAKLVGGIKSALFDRFAKYDAPELYGDRVVDGVIHSEGVEDGSFEQLLHERGIGQAFVSETPGLLALDRRVDGAAVTVEEFARVAAE